MVTLNRRLAELESKQTSSDLRGMTAEQLDARLVTLQAGSFEWLRVLVAGIQRRGSRLPLRVGR
jgi:hypothetical protein